MKTVLKQALGIILVPALLGLIVNEGLVTRFVMGEFARGFVAAAESGAVVFIGFEQARDLWQGREAQFIDARAVGLFAAGRIPGAVNIPIGEPDREGLLGRLRLDRSKPLVIYCSGGTCLDSLHLAQWLKANRAFDDIRVFQGGWQEWVDGGLPVEAPHDQE